MIFVTGMVSECIDWWMMPRPLRLVRDLRVFLGNSPLACRGSTANALERVGSLTPVKPRIVFSRRRAPRELEGLQGPASVETAIYMALAVCDAGDDTVRCRVGRN